VLRGPRLLGALLPGAGLGVLVGAFARSSGEGGWIFALLVGSAAVTAIAQQTLP
jgi:F0F1-type ATP synthase assembly protein I